MPRKSSFPDADFHFAALGIHENRNPAATPDVDHRLGQAAGLEQTFPVIGQDDCIRFMGVLINPPDHLFHDVGTERPDFLLVKPDEMLVVGNHLGFGYGRPVPAPDAQIPNISVMVVALQLRFKQPTCHFKK